MANQFDVTPPDPMGAANDWQRELANTSLAQSNASIAKTRVGEEADKAVLSHDAMLASQAFRDKVSKIDPSVKPMEKLSLIADAAMSSGRFEDAEKALAGMAHLAQVSTLDGVRQAQAEKARTDASDKKMKRAQELLQGVKSQDDLNMANSIFEAEFKEPSPLGPTYSETLRRVGTGTLTNALTQARIRTQEAQALRDDAATLKERQIAEATKALRDKRLAETKKIEEGLGKAGGKAATATKEEKNTTAAVLKKFFPDLDNADIAREEVSQEAKAVLARREASDFKAAVEKVIKENPGRFKEVDKSSWNPWSKEKKNVYGKDPEGDKPQPLPPKGTTLVEGKVYVAGGVSKRWTAKGWEDVK